jgi:uncharacterized membrane protein YpjA
MLYSQPAVSKKWQWAVDLLVTKVGVTATLPDFAKKKNRVKVKVIMVKHFAVSVQQLLVHPVYISSLHNLTVTWNLIKGYGS